MITSNLALMSFLVGYSDLNYWHVCRTFWRPFHRRTCHIFRTNLLKLPKFIWITSSFTQSDSVSDNEVVETSDIIGYPIHRISHHSHPPQDLLEVERRENEFLFNGFWRPLKVEDRDTFQEPQVGDQLGRFGSQISGKARCFFRQAHWSSSQYVPIKTNSLRGKTVVDWKWLYFFNICGTFFHTGHPGLIDGQALAAYEGILASISIRGVSVAWPFFRDLSVSFCDFHLPHWGVQTYNKHPQNSTNLCWHPCHKRQPLRCQNQRLGSSGTDPGMWTTMKFADDLRIPHPFKTLP